MLVNGVLGERPCGIGGAGDHIGEAAHLGCGSGQHIGEAAHTDLSHDPDSNPDPRLGLALGTGLGLVSGLELGLALTRTPTPDLAMILTAASPDTNPSPVIRRAL